MLFFGRAKREQDQRNRTKAQALVGEHGDAALDVVRERIAGSTWQIRDHEHWLRVEKHVRKLVRR
jgi:trehalose-6-phosphatase